MSQSFIKTTIFVLTIAISLSIFYKFNNFGTQNIQINSSTNSINQFMMSFFGFGSSSAKDEEWRKATSVYDFAVKDIDNQDVKLDKYAGKVMLIVNVASKCGFTKANYKELNQLYSKYKDEGLVILGFPCNQFGYQEPGCDVDIKEFIKKNGVEWDIFAKIDVNGDNAIPLYNYLKNKAGGLIIDAIKWNFTKFLISKQGVPVNRYAPNVNPLKFEDDIKAELNK